MQIPEGAKTFVTAPDMYDKFMGRFSSPLAVEFVKSLPLQKGQTALDIGCGPGALTAALVERLGAEAVSVMEPSPPFLAECLARNPGVNGKPGQAESIPFDDHSFDVVLSQLVLFFLSDPEDAGEEMIRVAKPGGLVAANIWDRSRMDMLAMFWQAASVAIGEGPVQPPEAELSRFNSAGNLASYFESLGLTDVVETTIEVQSEFEDFEELWSIYLHGIGPVGAWCVDQTDEIRAAIRAELFRHLGSPKGSFPLAAVAISAHGRTPS